MECLTGIVDRCCLSYLVFNVLTALVSNYNVCLNLFFFFLSFPIGFSVMLVVKLTESCLKKTTQTMCLLFSAISKEAKEIHCCNMCGTMFHYPYALLK